MPHYEYDKDYPFAAFITNLGKYNEGELVGEWVKFPTTAEELKEVFKRIGIGQKDDFGNPYEEWFITDYDCYVDGLYDKLGEYENLDELNYLASKLDEMDQSDYAKFQAAMEIGDYTSSLQEIINLRPNCFLNTEANLLWFIYPTCSAASATDSFVVESNSAAFFIRVSRRYTEMFCPKTPRK